MGDATIQDQGSSGLRRARRILSYGLAILLGPLVLGVGWLIVSQAGRLPPLTPDQFDAARQLWAERGPADYNLEVVVQGRQPATYRVEVRGGEVRQATRNGNPLRQARTLGTWSVPGMFSTMDADVTRVRRLAEGDRDPGLTPLVLRARFDPQWGYPVRYHRIENVRYGANPEVSWEVTRFETVGDGNRDSGQ